nr:geranylgeranyl transferase type-1 subunit beta [Cryptococcus depauperatus CBS 7841]
MTTLQQATFKKNAHINYFLRCLRALPSSAQENDCNRITVAYFCIAALDLLGVLYEKTTEEQRNGWIEWIWSLQARRIDFAATGGFQGSTFMTTSNPTTAPAHLPSTYTALLCLALLRAPLDRLNRPGLVAFIKSCQADSGSFSPLSGDEYILDGFQSDARMAYVACVISHIICDFSGIDIPRLKEWIKRCRTWEGGYASRPGVIEAQGGTTYCCLAALALINDNCLGKPVVQSDENNSTIVRWLVSRQIGGFQGRPGKLEDACYSFWCKGALNIMGHTDLINHESDKIFLLSAQFPLGGFGKEPEDYPDPYHSYLALAALSLSQDISSSELAPLANEPVDNREQLKILESGLDLKKLDVGWNVSRDTADWLSKEISKIKR